MPLASFRTSFIPNLLQIELTTEHVSALLSTLASLILHYSLYQILRHALRTTLLRFHESHVLKCVSLLFPKVCEAVKSHAEEKETSRRSAVSSSTLSSTSSSTRSSTPAFNAKRSSIFMTPSVHSQLANRLSEVSESSPSSPEQKPSVVKLRPLPYFETFLDPFLLLCLSHPPLLPHLRRLLPLRFCHAFHSHSDSLIHDSFLLAGYDDPTSHANYGLLCGTVKAIIATLAVRQGLALMGQGELSDSIWTGFGYGSIIIGYGLKELITDLLAGLSLFFSRTLLPGHKVEVFGKQAHVVKCGLRNVELRLIRDGEAVVVPNSKLVHEAITVYEGWEERRCSLQFVLDSGCKAATVERVKSRFRGALKAMPDVRISEPCIYLTGMRFGIEVEAVWYLTSYRDEIRKFKENVDAVVLNTKRILEEEGVEIVQLWPGR